MKGLTGLVIAGALGLLGVGVNMAYLHNKTKSIETVSFVGVRDGATIEIGKTIKAAHLEPVPIPTTRAEALKKYVYLWEDRASIVGIPATKMYRGGELVFESDYRTPVPRLTLESDETLLRIDVSTKTSLIEPGDEVSFVVPTAPASSGRRPFPPGPTGEASESPDTPPAGPGGGFEIHGPFRVAAIGNRISSREVMQAYKLRQENENQIGIIVKVETNSKTGKTQFEARATTLLEAMQNVNSRSVTVILHARPPE